jgi:rod shape-determining protein MreC
VRVIRLSPVRRAMLQRIALPCLVLASAAMIVVDRADQAAFRTLRSSVADAAAPALDALSQPLTIVSGAVTQVQGVIATYRDNARLVAENERLSHWQQAALRLEAENARLRSLLHLVPEAAVSFVTARVIANSGGAYVRSLLVDAGGNHGVARGQAAVTGDGLVGRVTETGRRTARVLLVTDLNSRVPVEIVGSGARAILAGDNSERPRLLYLDGATTVKIGSRVVTSGQGGVFPPGLPVGVVATIAGKIPRVDPYVDLARVDYLRIVDYGLAAGLPRPVPLDRGRRHLQAAAGGG